MLRLSAICVCALLAIRFVWADEPTGPKESDQRAQMALASVVDRLESLGVKFDADKNKSLSAEEQRVLIDYVAKTYGQAWADRVAAHFRAIDANGDGVVDLAEWDLGLKAVRKLRPASAGNAPREGMRETIMIPMSDGVRLATDVYRPVGEGRFPVVLTRTPYHRTKTEGYGRAMARNGYVVVAQDMRGRFESEGENLPFIGCGWGEHRDGAETVAWIQQQTWCNGRIGTVGGSAGGITQNLLAGTAPTGLTAQHISVAAASMYHHATYVGGALRKEQIENWSRTNHFDPRATEIVREHLTYDDYWRGQDATLKFKQVNVPAVHVGGWFDTFAQGTIDAFVGRQYEGADGARGRQKLVMGPWAHGVGKIEDGSELKFPNAGFPEAYETGRWFAHHLAGEDNGVMQEPAVMYYVMGDTSDPQAPGNQWRTSDTWPVASQLTPYFLHESGKLSATKNEAAEATREYTFDPANPVPTLGGNNLTIERGPRNQNPIESRPDVLVFTSEPLGEPLEVTGRVVAKVFVCSSAVDTDLSVRLGDVYPDGKCYNMAEGILRLRYRDSFEKARPLTPGEVVEARVDCWSTSVVFNRGHRVRVTIASGNHPRFDLNPGTGRAWVDGAPFVRQTNRIYCSGEQASCILLPVVR